MMMNRRSLMLATTQVGVVLSAIATGKNKTGETKNSAPEHIALQPLQFSSSWLWVGRAALAQERTRAHELL